MQLNWHTASVEVLSSRKESLTRRDSKRCSAHSVKIRLEIIWFFESTTVWYLIFRLDTPQKVFTLLLKMIRFCWIDRGIQPNPSKFFWFKWIWHWVTIRTPNQDWSLWDHLHVCGYLVVTDEAPVIWLGGITSRVRSRILDEMIRRGGEKSSQIIPSQFHTKEACPRWSEESSLPKMVDLFNPFEVYI